VAKKKAPRRFAVGAALPERCHRKHSARGRFFLSFCAAEEQITSRNGGDATGTSGDDANADDATKPE